MNPTKECEREEIFTYHQNILFSINQLMNDLEHLEAPGEDTKGLTLKMATIH